MKRAFTLIELIVVIGILGILMATLIGVFSGGNEQARATQCLANMKNLANAVHGYLGSTKYWPLAGSVERARLGNGMGGMVYSEMAGWVSWDSRGAYCSGPTSHRASQGWYTSAYNMDDTVREYAITNGAIWGAISGARSCYTCPSHAKAIKGLQRDPAWSYVMNAYFGWDWTGGKNVVAIDSEDPRIMNDSAAVKNAHKILLFAELPWTVVGGSSAPNTSAASGIENDCVLQYKGCASGIGEAESIGFNHKSGRDTVAHVVFADGHTEKIIWSANQDLQELTRWLCTGVDIQYDSSSKRWEEIK